ncbi:hypothetical protein WR25_13240 [Diploscapter pachys]|uniref:Uncharacterized protein n=1 Tax=Diploscapter pachys TaxID=2018661 RepID=A0A2A2LJI1_9BILA|nr:hypothetical protein WR25_13240 [Diploscapter pachys]
MNLQAETIANFPEDIDESVILEDKKKYDEVRRKRQEDHELLRNVKMLPLEKRSMTKEQIKQLIYVRRPNETHEAQRQKAGMILFNWNHGTNLTYNPWLKFNSFVRPVNLERREQVIRAMVEKWVRQKRAPGDCVDTCAPPVESPTPQDPLNYPGYMTYSKYGWAADTPDDAAIGNVFYCDSFDPIPTTTSPTTPSTSTTTPSTSTTTPSTSTTTTPSTSSTQFSNARLNFSDNKFQYYADDCVDTCLPPIESTTPQDPLNYPGYMTYSIDTTSGCSKMTISCTGLGGAFIGSRTTDDPKNNYYYDLPADPNAYITITTDLDCNHYGWAALTPGEAAIGNVFYCDSFDPIPATTSTTSPTSTTMTTTTSTTTSSTSTTTPSTSTTTPSTSTTTPSTSTTTPSTSTTTPSTSTTTPSTSTTVSICFFSFE